MRGDLLSDLMRHVSNVATSAASPPRELDLLKSLRDIHEPAPPAFWPPAPGWWILGAAVLTAGIAFTIWWLRRRRIQRPIRAALAELDAWQTAAAAGGDPVQHAEVLAALLRRAALVRYPRGLVASLTGEAWLRFLDRTSGTTAFTVGAGRLLGDDRYAPGIELAPAPLAAIARRWLTEHLDGANLEPEVLAAEARAHGHDDAPQVPEAA